MKTMIVGCTFGDFITALCFYIYHTKALQTKCDKKKTSVGLHIEKEEQPVTK